MITGPASFTSEPTVALGKPVKARLKGGSSVISIEEAKQICEEMGWVLDEEFHLMNTLDCIVPVKGRMVTN